MLGKAISEQEDIAKIFQFRSRKFECKETTLLVIQKDLDNIINARTNRQPRKGKEVNEHNNQLQETLKNDIIEFDKPDIDQNGNAAPIANNDNDDVLPSLTEILNGKRDLSFVSNNININSNDNERALKVAGYYDINEIDW